MAAVNDRAQTNEDTPVTTNVLANDRDPAGGVGRLTGIETAPEHGLARIDRAEGTITYTPSQDFNGTDSLVYRAVDSSGTATTATLDITVQAVNDPPVAYAAGCCRSRAQTVIGERRHGRRQRSRPDQRGHAGHHQRPGQ